MNKPVYHPTDRSTNHRELSRLLTAAVINMRFRNLLLSSPQKALESGYNGESFRLAAEDKSQIISIQALSLADFATQLNLNRGTAVRV